MFLVFNWCAQPGVQSAMKVIRTIINIIRWVVPIGLVVMTTVDLFSKVLNPDDKNAQKKIMNRVIAAVIVFFVPTLVSLVLRLVDIGRGVKTNSSSSVSACWRG